VGKVYLSDRRELRAVQIHSLHHGKKTKEERRKVVEAEARSE
jgi:hypothetical protein